MGTWVDIKHVKGEGKLYRGGKSINGKQTEEARSVRGRQGPITVLILPFPGLRGSTHGAGGGDQWDQHYQAEGNHEGGRQS